MRLSSQSSGVDRIDAGALSRRLVLAAGAAGLAGLVVPASAEAASTGTFAVTASPLNVRSGPGTSYAKVGTLAYGTKITATTSGTWRKITAGTFTGRWVHSAYLRAAIGTSSTFKPLPYVTSVPVLAGGVTMRAGWNGTRVMLVRKRLGISISEHETMDAKTIDAVKRFQRSKGLVVDGIPGPKTWAAMGITHRYTIDNWTKQPIAAATDTSTQRMEKALAWAMGQRGSQYTWGGAGPYALGYDCSGLALQYLYAGGINPAPITVLKHAEPTYRTSQQLYAHSGMKRLPLSERRRGDLVFYTDTSGIVRHVAIMLDRSTFLEALGSVRTRGFVTSYASGTRRVAPYIRRPFL